MTTNANKPAHSPLPWTREGWNGDSSSTNNYRDGCVLRGKIISADGHAIASSGAFGVVSGKTPKQSIANAELIVRAVNSHAELLAALAWYADKVSGIHGNDDAEALEDDQGERARAAIAKATA